MGALLAVVELVVGLLVDLSAQRLEAFDATGRLVSSAPVSSGLPSSPTPTTAFRICAT
jgi:hypothetical protein